MDVVTGHVVAAADPAAQPNYAPFGMRAQPVLPRLGLAPHVGGPPHPTRRSSVAVAIRVPCVKAASGGQLLDV
jgi:hypothetical protein